MKDTKDQYGNKAVAFCFSVTQPLECRKGAYCCGMDVAKVSRVY